MRPVSSDDCVVNLRSGDEKRGIIEESQVPLAAVRDVLAYLGFENAPFPAMTGALSIVRSQFYPTDDEHVDDPLAYYRQREWRITADYSVNNRSRRRVLPRSERQRLLEVDGPFWNRELSIQHETFRRVDKAVSLDVPSAKDVRSMMTRLVVPSECLDRATRLFPDVIVESDST